jgi:hypothetical protein
MRGRVGVPPAHLRVSCRCPNVGKSRHGDRWQVTTFARTCLEWDAGASPARGTAAPGAPGSSLARWAPLGLPPAYVAAFVRTRTIRVAEMEPPTLLARTFVTVTLPRTHCSRVLTNAATYRCRPSRGRSHQRGLLEQFNEIYSRRRAAPNQGSSSWKTAENGYSKT